MKKGELMIRSSVCQPFVSHTALKKGFALVLGYIESEVKVGGYRVLSRAVKWLTTKTMSWEKRAPGCHQ